MKIIEIMEGQATGVIINETVHILKPSLSSYGLTVNGVRRQYCCQNQCCDCGFQVDTSIVVVRAKELGANRVVVRRGQQQYCCMEVAGLPVECVSNQLREIGDGIFINQI